MGKNNKKTQKQRRAAAANLEQRTKDRKEARGNSTVDSITEKAKHIPFAAEFLMNADRKQAQKDSNLPVSVINKISNRNYAADKAQATGILFAATNQGWKPPTNKKT